MRTILVLLVMSVALSAHAQPIGPARLGRSVTFPGVTPSPTDYAWELRTAADDVVRWEWNNVAAIDGSGAYVQSREATVDNAASLGLDWNAWTAALLDKDFNRALVIWNGQTVEMTWPAHPDQRIAFHDVRQVTMKIEGWAWPAATDSVTVGLNAHNSYIVPEPACWFMLCLGLLHVGIHRRR